MVTNTIPLSAATDLWPHPPTGHRSGRCGSHAPDQQRRIDQRDVRLSPAFSANAPERKRPRSGGAFVARTLKSSSVSGHLPEYTMVDILRECPSAFRSGKVRAAACVVTPVWFLLSFTTATKRSPTWNCAKSPSSWKTRLPSAPIASNVGGAKNRTDQGYLQRHPPTS